MRSLLQLAREKLIPGVRNSNWAYRDVLETLLTVAPDRWLDLGCGHQLMPDWMSDGAVASSRLTNRARVPVGIDAAQELNSALRPFQQLLAYFQVLDAQLVAGKCLTQVKFAAFQLADNRFKLSQRILEAAGDVVGPS